MVLKQMKQFNYHWHISTLQEYWHCTVSAFPVKSIIANYSKIWRGRGRGSIRLDFILLPCDNFIAMEKEQKKNGMSFFKSLHHFCLEKCFIVFYLI